FGIQFHAEVTHAMMCRWTTRGHARMEMPGAKGRAAHFAERPVYDHAIRTWLATFLDAWLARETVMADAAVRARESSIDRYPLANSAAMMRSRVSGRSRMRAPSACATALPIAAAVGPAVASPTPSGTSESLAISSTVISGTSEKRSTG